MKHWIFEIKEFDSGEILISAEGNDGSRWQEWINKKAGQLCEFSFKPINHHKVTPVEDWAIRTEINHMMHLLAAFFQKDMQNVESYKIFEGNVLYQKPDPAKAYWAREPGCHAWAEKHGFTTEDIPPISYEWKNILNESGNAIINYKEAEKLMDENIREETARETAPSSQQIFYIIDCIAHNSKFGCPFSID